MTTLDVVVPEHLLDLDDPSRDIPKLAKDELLTKTIEGIVSGLPTTQRLYEGSANDVERWRAEIGRVDLVVTSPPYWNLKEYPRREGQLGWEHDYETFLEALRPAWETCYEALVPGGRLVIVVGDVCLSRRKNKGRHTVVPLHAAIQEQCRAIGFDNLAPIIWHKIANVQHETKGNGGSFLGKPYEPNAVIKNDIEYILMQRKPGGYRSVDLSQRVLSVIPKHLHDIWFRQVWDALPGASTRSHPAPYPQELANRLVRMFSFVGDVVLDPFVGSGTTLAAAASAGRNGIGIDIEPSYLDLTRQRLGDIPTACVTT